MMTDTRRTDYLAHLDAALRDLPHGIAAEIRSGVAEELAGLDGDALAARIAELGDPAAIAREAMDAGGYFPTVPVIAPQVAAPPRPATRTKGFAIAAALVLSFGGFVVPFLGWIAGVVMVCLSTLWRRWEKVVAIVVPLAAGVFAAAWTIPVFSFTTEGPFEDSGSGLPPEAANPLLPGVYDVIWSVPVLLAFLLIPASGLWLLWRLRGRAGD